MAMACLSRPFVATSINPPGHPWLAPGVCKVRDKLSDEPDRRLVLVFCDLK